jgi:predicted nucleic acid-binding protein
MKHISDHFTVVLDANVLYPFLVRDVLLSLAHSGLFRPLWTADIMNEWQSALTARRPHTSRKIARTVQLMADHFPEAMVTGYERLIPAIDLPDPNDRHVLAAAIKAGANAIITENIRDFPVSVISSYDIEIKTADELVLSTLDLYPDEAVRALKSRRKSYTKPPMTAEEFHSALLAKGFVQTSAELLPRLGSL